jgi:hypothetical protein
VQIDPDTPDSPYNGLWLQQNTAEKCWEGRHLNYMLGGGFVGLVIVVLGIPIGHAAFLWRNRMRLEEPEMLLRFGFTYDGFRREACYYESVIMMRKLALVVRARATCWACRCLRTSSRLLTTLLPRGARASMQTQIVTVFFAHSTPSAGAYVLAISACCVA